MLDRDAERLADACHALARVFARGGSLIAAGEGPAATDAAHVAVEFMHPVIVGKRALPALALSNDPTGACTLGAISRPDDIVLALDHGQAPGTRRLLDAASEGGLLSLAITGPGFGARTDHLFTVPSEDPAVVQEVQETMYHVLWELVHVFFEHRGLVEEACLTCGDVAVEARVTAVDSDAAVVERGGAHERVAVDLVEPVEVGDRVLCHAGVAIERLEGDAATPAFLYPFLDERPAAPDLDSILADVSASTRRKGAEVIELRRAIDVAAVAACAGAIRGRLALGGRVLAFGNGGSATDAQDLAADLLGRGWPALSLTNDAATVTAVANDVGYERVFARQVIPLAGPRDVAIGISTSGTSPNVVAGLEEAHDRGLLTCGIAGYDGGRLGELTWLDHLFVVRSQDIPRLQEAHATIYHLLVEAIGERA